MTCEYLRDCLTLARAPDSSAIKWQLFAFVADFRNFGFSKPRDKKKKERPRFFAHNCVYTRTERLRASDPDPNKKHQDSSNDHLKCCAEKRRVHIPLSDPADD